ncbi:MAG: dimethylsulfonioproprionate lyase family protein [Pseudomonadota bacterium]
MLDPNLFRLRETFRNYASGQAPDINAFCGEALFADHPEADLEPSTLPAVANIKDLSSSTADATRELFDAVVAAAPHVHWQQSYTTDDHGIDDFYLANYGWFNLIAPSGPFISNDIRVSVGYWGRGLTYPNHWHEPEEIYLTIAGSALYVSHGRMPVRGGPGTTICHYSNQPHSADFDQSPLLAAAFWRGNGLEAKSRFQESS